MRSRLATAGTIACLLVPAACTGDPTSAEATSPSPSPVVTDSGTTAGPRSSDPTKRLNGEVLRARGFLALRLGMSRKEATSTGRVSIGETTGRCTGFYLARYGGSAGMAAHGYFTRGRGLSVIRGQDGMHTPRGVGFGSPYGELQNSFAHLVGSPEFTTAAVSDRTSYYFVSENDSITAFGLAMAGDPCLKQALD